MKGIDKITARLDADARAEVERLNAEADAQCDAIAKEYAEKAQAVYDDTMKSGAKDCALRAERLRNAADMEARKAMLAFRQEMVGEAFSRAAEKLCSMPKEDYVKFLAALASNAAVWGDEVLVFNDRDRAAVGKDVANAANALLKERGIHGGLTVAEETREIPGGLIVSHGDIEVNCATDTLLAMSRSELSGSVAEILFP